MKATPQPYITSIRAAHLLDESPLGIEALIRDGVLDGHEVDGTLFVSRVSVVRLQQQRVAR